MNETLGENKSPQPETVAVVGPTSPVVPEKPRRWLVIKSTAVLASVAATNYVCYGGKPVVQIGSDEPSSLTDPARLSLALALRDSEAHMTLAIPHMELKNHETSVRQSVWNGYERERRLQVLWVWDFFRIQSHIALRVALPPEDHTGGDDRWSEMIAAMRGLQPGSRIDVEVQSACGDIMQLHVLNDPAAEWMPE